MNLTLSLDQLENAQLVRRTPDPEPAYIFKHALTQDTAYASLLHAQRREIHRRVAQAYEHTYGGDVCLDEYAGILARHYAEAGDAERTLTYATQAGDVAARTYAHPEAIAFYTQALDAARRGDATTAEFIHVYARRGRAHELAGDYVRAVENYVEMQALARAKGDRTLELESLILQTTAYAIGAGGVRDAKKAQAFSMQALALAEELGDRAAQSRIYWNLLLINRFGGDGPAKAVEYGEKSLALARELGMTEQVAYTLKDLAVAYVVVGRLDLANANVPEVIGLWRQLGNIPMLAEVIGGTSQAQFMQGKLDAAAQLGEESYRLNRSIGNKLGLSLTGTFLWYSYRELGQLKQAIDLAEESIALAEELKFHGPQWASLVEVAATFEWLGDYARATEYARRALSSIAPDTPYNPVFPRAVLASIALHQGDRAHAEEWLANDSFDSLETYLHMNPAGAMHPIATRVELALAQGDAPRALTLTTEALALAEKITMPVAWPVIAHLQAKALRMLGREDKAYDLLVEARKRAGAMQARYRLLPILFTLLEVEMERGDAAQAERVRAEAREVIDYVTAHLTEELRRSFLNLPDVRRVA